NDGDSSDVHLERMWQILREFSTDPILSMYVIDDVWEYMKAMKLVFHVNRVLSLILFRTLFSYKCIISMLLGELSDEDSTNLSARKAVGVRIVPAADNRKQYHNKAQNETFEKNKRDITVAMMKNYPQLLRKFMADKAKVPSLVEIIMYMNLGLYSLKRQEQNFKSVLKLMKDAFFKHGEKESLRSCVKAIQFCSSESQGELQDYARNKSKDIEDELIAKLKYAMKEVADGGDEYSLLVNLKRLYELQLSRAVPFESFYEDIVSTLHNFRNLDDEAVSVPLLNLYLHVAWSLHSFVNSETVSESSLASPLSERNNLCEQLEFFLNSPSEFEEGTKVGNQLASRVSIFLSSILILSTSSLLMYFLLNFRYILSTSRVHFSILIRSANLFVTDEMEDEDLNKEYVEETNRDAVMIAAAKLVASDTISKEYLGPEIISHCVMHGTSVAETIKHLITVLKKNNEDIHNLLPMIGIWLYVREVMSLTGKSFRECKDLATRLSGTYVGAAWNKHRFDILRIVKEGIDYAFVDVPKQLSFLEAVVLHFVTKLPTPDITNIVKDVEKRTENVNTDEDPNGWRYYTFVENLQEKYAKKEDLQDEREGTTDVRRRGSPRKRHNIEGKRLSDGHNRTRTRMSHSLSEEQESISTSNLEDAQDEVEKQDEEDEEAPLIQSIRSSSKLRQLRVSRSTQDNLVSSRTS
ncbi:LOW QUALITY PROTEIN: hypothetical protein CFOL_v3_29271, partial [Cephalotus follicularis]